MSEPDETTVMDWAEHNDHADDGANAREEALMYGGEPEPPEDDGWEYVYSRDQVRPVLSEDMYERVRTEAQEGASLTGGLESLTLDTVIQTTLASVGLLTPPVDVQEEEEQGRICEATWPNRMGWWLQCKVSPDTPHQEHRDGDEVWTDADANAIPSPQYSTEPPF